MAAFTTAAAGLWSDPATWTTAIPAGGPGLLVGDNDTVTINHDVTHDRAGITWLGTGAGTAVQINAGGAIRMSRSASGTLRCWGNVIVATLGTIDFGTIASPIPAGVDAFLEFRSANQFGLTCNDNSESYFVGTPTRTRWTRLIAAGVSGAANFRVADATGWQVNDYVVIAASVLSYNVPYFGRITAVTNLGPGDWQVDVTGNLNVDYSINKPVGNLMANVAINGVRPTAPYDLDLTINNAGIAGHFGTTFTNTGTIRANTRVFRSCRIGCGGAAGNRQIVINNRVTGSTAWSENQDVVFSSRGGTSIRFDSQMGTWRLTGAVFDYSGIETNAQLFQVVITGFTIDDFMWTYALLANGPSSFTGVTFRNGHIGGTFTFQASNSGFLSDTLFEDVEFGPAANTFGNQGPGTGGTFRRCLYALPYSQDPARGYMESTGSATGYLPTLNASCSGVYTIVDSIFNSTINLDTYYGLGGGGGITTVVSPNTRVIIANKDQDPAQQTIYTPDGWFKNDTATILSGPYSLRWTPNTRGRPQSLTFNVLAPDGAQVPVSGYIRRDAAYVAASGSIVVTLSGPGITAVSYTSVGAADTWEQFAFNVVQNTGAPAVLVLTLTFLGTAGNAWAEDIVAPSSQPVSTGEFGYWANGQPVQTILANFSPAADVWSIPIANLTVPGSIGEALSDVEDGLTVQEALRLLLAVLVGETTGGPGAPVFKSLDGTKNRVVGTATAVGDRTRTSIDPT